MGTLGELQPGRDTGLRHFPSAPHLHSIVYPSQKHECRGASQQCRGPYRPYSQDATLRRATTTYFAQCQFVLFAGKVDCQVEGLISEVENSLRTLAEGKGGSTKHGARSSHEEAELLPVVLPLSVAGQFPPLPLSLQVSGGPLPVMPPPPPRSPALALNSAAA